MVKITPLTPDKLTQAVELVFNTGLDTKKEIEHHLKQIDAHYIALDGDKIVGVVGWYQDNVNYASRAMGDKFPGTEAYWVGFFAVDKKYRGLGIGGLLLKKLEEVIKLKNTHELWVSSVSETQSYYEKKGFQLVMKGEIAGNLKSFLVKKLEI